MEQNTFESPPQAVWALNLNYVDQSLSDAAQEFSLCIGDPSIVRFDPTLGNLRSKLLPLNKRICIIFLQARSVVATGGCEVELADNDAVPLDEVYSLFASNREAIYFLVLVFDDVTESETVESRGQREAVFCVDRRSLSAVVRIFGALVSGWSARSLVSVHRDERHYFRLMAHGLDKIGTLLGSPLKSSFKTYSSQHLNIVEESVTTHAVLSRFNGTWSDAYVVDEVTRLLQSENEFLRAHSTPAQRLSWAASLLWLLEVGDQYVGNWFEVSDIYFTHIDPGSELALVLNDFEMRQADVSKVNTAEFVAAFVAVPAGHFHFGVTRYGAESEPPAPFHQRELGSFRILDRPVTVGDLRLFLDHASVLERLRHMDSDLPATMMSAAEALSFADIVEKCARDYGLIKGNERVTLPDEYQWEVAAGGFAHTDYPWGDEFNAAYCNSNMSDGERVLSVYSFSPEGNSEFGCTDMAGNVREWTRSVAVDSSGESYKAVNPPTRQLLDLSSRDRMVVRGGSFTYNDKCVRTWVRNNQGAYHRDLTTGFRLVIETH